MTYYRFGLLMTTLLLSQSAPAQQTPAQPDNAAADLQATIDQYNQAYNAGAIDQVMSHWAENADFVDINGRFHEGRELISALFRRGFADNPGRTIQFESLSRKFLAPEVVVDDGILELTSADGEKNRGRYTVVWTRMGGKWLIRSARDIPLEAEAMADVVESPPLEELAWLVGKWQAKSDKYEIALECDWQLNKEFLVQTFQVKSSQDDFQVVTYIGFDPAEGVSVRGFLTAAGASAVGPGRSATMSTRQPSFQSCRTARLVPRSCPGKKSTTTRYSGIRWSGKLMASRYPMRARIIFESNNDVRANRAKRDAIYFLAAISILGALR